MLVVGGERGARPGLANISRTFVQGGDDAARLELTPDVNPKRLESAESDEGTHC